MGKLELCEVTSDQFDLGFCHQLPQLPGWRGRMVKSLRGVCLPDWDLVSIIYWLCNLITSLTTLGLSFPICKMRIITELTNKVIVITKEITHEKHLKQCIVYNEHSVNVSGCCSVSVCSI